MSGRKVSISLESEFDPESSFSVIFLKVSISLESEFMSEGSAGRPNPLNLTGARTGKHNTFQKKTEQKAVS
jgi:hypothetical protein